MATDYWPDEEGQIVPCLELAFCYAETTFSAMSIVKMGGTTTAGRLQVTKATGVGDGYAVALKEADDIGDYVPVCFYGVCKLQLDDYSYDPAAGGFVMNSKEADILEPGTVASTGLEPIASGASYILGMALQAGAAASDEILVLVGRGI